MSFFAVQFSVSQPGLYEIEAGAFYYSPGELIIESGSTVTWINVGGLHDVNGVTNSITSLSFNNPEDFSLSAVYSAGPASPVEIGSFTFTEVGTYTYDCSIGSHAAQGMVGTIVVTPQAEYPGCMDISACNYDPIANIDNGSCLYNDICCPGFDLECIACEACQTPEEFCLANPGYEGCDAYDVVGCMDDGLQEWSPFPGIAADDYEPGANTPGECAYWGCGNPDNTLMLVGTFMDLSGENGWNGTSMTVTNIWEDSYIYDVGDTVFYFSPTLDIMYELPPLPTVDCCGLIDESGSPDEFDELGNVNPDYNPNYGGDLPDGQVNHDDCLECPLNPDFVGNTGYVVNFCAPDDLLDGCYNLFVDNGDPQQIAWQIQNAEISVFALTGSANFDETSGSACTEDPDDSGFDFYDIGVQSASFDNDPSSDNYGMLTTQVCNYGNETTADSDGVETAGTTWILIDGIAEISDTPSDITAVNPLGDVVTGNGYYWGSCYEFNYDLTELISADDLGPGTHTITVWVNGGSVQPLGSLTDFNETFYENNYSTITFEIPYVYGCMDSWASNYNPNANIDIDSNGNLEPCYYACGDTDGDGIVDDNSYQSLLITMEDNQAYPWDAGWSIQTIDGEEILSGGAPYDSSPNELCLAPDCYQLIMTDSYGANGWFGDVLNIGDSSFTLDDGAEEIILFQVSEPEDLECPCINPDWISPGPCGMIYMPVLGCNGVEYSNSCLAENAGVTSYTDVFSGVSTVLEWDCGLSSSPIGLCDNC